MLEPSVLKESWRKPKSEDRTMGNPVYHLRPNKAVDRNLFVECLVKLEKILDLSHYRYIGFGSYEFDEFKLVYRSLGIQDLHSIEMNSDVFKRQSFNKPYSCIELFNKTCETYFDEDYDENKHSIIWMDFSEANNKYAQCQDISNICGKIQEGDILRITLNANSSGIPTGDVPPADIPGPDRKERFKWLKENLREYFPEIASENDITEKQYPLFLLRVIKKAVYQDMSSDLFACPICNYVYSDGTQMMTFTIYIGASNKREKVLEELQRVYNGWKEYVRINVWDNPIKIDLPLLTVHEQLEIRQYEPNADNIKQIEERMGIKEEDINKYLLFARYYPNYQPVII